MAAAAEIYAKRQKLSQDSIDYAHDIKIEALRQIGEMLKQTERHPPGPEKQDQSTATTDPQPTLSDLGLTRDQASLAQKLASLPAEQFNQVRAGTMAVTAALREVRRATAKPAPAMTGQYRVLYADPATA